MGRQTRIRRATNRQLNRIEELRHLLRFADAGWSRWLAQRFHVRSLSEIRDWATAQKINGALVILERRRDHGAAERHLRALGRAARQSR